MRFKTKLVVAFGILVVLLGLLQTVYFQQKIGQVFEAYVMENEKGRIDYYKDYLSDYYEYYGSWDQIQAILQQDNFSRPGKGPWRGNGNPPFGMGMGMRDLDIMVADSEGVIVGDTKKQEIGQQAKKVSGIREEIVVNGRQVGELIVYKEKGIGLLSIEQQFMNSMNRSILFGTTISVGIAVLIGLFLSKQVTKPLEKLMVGIRKITKGETSYRISVETKDEFGKLASAFNDMSSELERNEEVRKNLVADVAHELRTPLSVLRGKLESIQEGAIQPSQEVIVQLGDEVFRLTRLVNDLQQLSLADAGKLPLHKEKTELTSLVERVVSHFHWMAEEKNIALTFHAQEEMWTEIDVDRITQVIINLLGNALRHTPEEGKVQIKVAKDMINHEVLIKVQDTGPGIEEEFLPYIFDRFYRTDNSRSRDQGGTGLGLSIAKGFVEVHGGRIEVESQKDVGSTFIIRLPID